MRYFADRDNSGHWYVVEENHRQEWGDWKALDEDDPASWNVPDCAYRLNGSINQLTFASPQAPFAIEEP